MKQENSLAMYQKVCRNSLIKEDKIKAVRL